MCSIIGFSFIGSNGFGSIEVYGLSLIPWPPAIITIVAFKLTNLFV